jgi:hypothetical protein
MTPDQISAARALRQQGHGWTDIGKAVGVNYYRVRRLLDPEWAQRRRDGINSLRRRERLVQTGSARGQVWESYLPRNPTFDPRRDGVVEPQNINQLILGDPLPGRSALDAKRGISYARRNTT